MFHVLQLTQRQRASCTVHCAKKFASCIQRSLSLFRLPYTGTGTGLQHNHIAIHLKTKQNHYTNQTMSLSFVSKTIQTSRDDGGYDETPVEGSDVGSSYKEPQKPLFEQLRANKEQEEAERAEQQISMMRGTLALDAEDCAHLEALRKQKLEEETERQREAAEEIAAFKTAQADRASHSLPEDSESQKTVHLKRAIEVTKKRETQPRTLMPKIIAKKRKQDIPNTENKQNASGKQIEMVEAPKDASSSIGGLLSGYGSEEEDEDE